MHAGRVLLGGVLVSVGVLLALEAAGLVSAGAVIATWWPLVLLAAAALMYVTNPRHPLPPLVLGMVAATALLVTTGVADGGVWALVGPAILIAVGLSIMLRPHRRPRAEADEAVRSFVVFSGNEVASHSDRFSGGSVTAVFGGTDLDLRDARLAEGASLDVLTAFGGTEIRVPEGWNVVIHGLPVFGGFENVTTREQLSAGAPRLDVNATVLFGGLEVKH